MSKLETNTIDTISGTNTLQVGDGNVATINLGKSGDTINIPSGATITNSGTANNFGATNTPLFRAYASSNWNMANGATTIVPYNAESFDPQSTFNTSTYKFTPGVAGKYFFYAIIKMSSSGAGDPFEIYLKQNNSTPSAVIYRAADNNAISLQISTILESDDNDEFYVDIYQASGGSITNYGGENISFFTGFKIA